MRGDRPRSTPVRVTMPRVASVDDRRPLAAAQRQLSAAIHTSPRVAAARRLSAGVGSSERVLARQATEARVVQRAVSASATYVPGAAAALALQALDAQIPAAELAAGNSLQHPPGGVHTPRQANYVLQPSPRSWGCCVEEQLDPVAAGQGWQTQQALQGSRPDYYRNIAGTHVFADLTTAAQANPGGNHITTKLQFSAPHYHGAAAWQAADVTHSGQQPGGGAPPALQPNGLLTAAHIQRFQQYAAYLMAHSNYDPVLNQVRGRYGPISTPRFTQVWNQAQRDAFVAAFNVPVNDEESSYSMDSDEENN